MASAELSYCHIAAVQYCARGSLHDVLIRARRSKVTQLALMLLDLDVCPACSGHVAVPIEAFCRVPGYKTPVVQLDVVDLDLFVSSQCGVW